MTAPATTRRRWTVGEYFAMAEDGLLHPDERVELLDGDVVMMSPIGPHHEGVVNTLTKLLVRLVGDSAVVSVQNSFWLDEHSMPQPDLAVLSPRTGDYRDRHPNPGDILLVIEVAKSSLRFDLEVKVPLYARAGIPEIWVIDLDNAVLLAHRDPSREGYETIEAHRADAQLPLPGLPGLTMPLADILDEPTGPSRR